MTDSKTCENPACGAIFERGSRSRADFATRRYCGRACSIAMRSRHRAIPAKPQPTAVTSTTGLWRPPGWAPTPNIGRPSVRG